MKKWTKIFTNSSSNNAPQINQAKQTYYAVCVIEIAFTENNINSLENFFKSFTPAYTDKVFNDITNAKECLTQKGGFSAASIVELRTQSDHFVVNNSEVQAKYAYEPIMVKSIFVGVETTNNKFDIRNIQNPFYTEFDNIKSNVPKLTGNNS